MYKEYVVTYREYPNAPIQRQNVNACNEQHVKLKIEFENEVTRNHLVIISIIPVITLKRGSDRETGRHNTHLILDLC